MSNQISRRSFIAGAVSGLIVSVVGGFKSMAAAFTYNTILGRPSKNSIAVSVLSQSSGVAYVEYGTSGKTFPSKSAQLQIQPETPRYLN